MTAGNLVRTQIDSDRDARTAIAFAQAHGYVYRINQGVLERAGWKVSVRALVAIGNRLGWERAGLVLSIAGSVTFGNINELVGRIQMPEA